MFVVVWQFEIAEEKISAFEAAYGPEGNWAQLFRSSPEYLGTELLRDAYISGFVSDHRPLGERGRIPEFPQRERRRHTKRWTGRATP